MNSLDELACRFVLNVIEPGSLSQIAESLIADGFSSPSLTALLVCDSSYTHDHATLFGRALSELGVEIPTREDAACVLAAGIARTIVTGTTTPYDGAYSIWKNVLDHLDTIPPRLWAFKSNASAIEDCVDDTRQFGSNHDDLIASCNAEILTAAHMLLQSSG